MRILVARGCAGLIQEFLSPPFSGYQAWSPREIASQSFSFIVALYFIYYSSSTSLPSGESGSWVKTEYRLYQDSCSINYFKSTFKLYVLTWKSSVVAAKEENNRLENRIVTN